VAVDSLLVKTSFEFLVVFAGGAGGSDNMRLKEMV
jgi:hypothetical protein